MVDLRGKGLATGCIWRQARVAAESLNVSSRLSSWGGILHVCYSALFHKALGAQSEGVR